MCTRWFDHLLRRQLLLPWYLGQQRVRVRVMIGCLVRGRVRFEITIRVRVRFNVSVYHRSNCRRSKCCTFVHALLMRHIVFHVHCLWVRHQIAQFGVVLSSSQRGRRWDTCAVCVQWCKPRAVDIVNILSGNGRGRQCHTCTVYTFSDVSTWQLKPMDSFGMWWKSNEIIFLHWIIIL